MKKYRKVSCHTTVKAAKDAAKRLRSAGKTASVRKNKKGACVFSAGAAKIGRTKRRKRRAA